MQQLEQIPRPHAEPHRLLDDIQFYVGVARRGWKLIAIAVGISIVLACIHLARSTTLYRASARILLIQQAGRPLAGAGGSDPFRASQDSSDSIATHLLIMRSPVVVENAIKLSGLEGVSTSAVIDGLAIKQPDPAAKIVELTFRSPSKVQAEKVVDGVMQSYNNFLKENFQKNTTDTIQLIGKARDELSRQLTSLEHEYLEHRRKNPAYSADDSGRSFIARRLDQWDQSMNQVLSRSLQLKSQLELGRKLAGEGLDQETITSALNQLNGLGGMTVALPSTPGEGRVMTGQSVESLRQEIVEVESQRVRAELLLSHLRRELAASAATVSERDVIEAFYDDPDVSRLQFERKEKKTKLQSAQRLSRSGSDPAILNLEKRIQELDQEIRGMWEQMKPALTARLANSSNLEISSSVRKAQADVIHSKARLAALREQLERMSSTELQRLRRERAQVVRDQGAGSPKIRQIDQQIARIERGADDLIGQKTGGDKDNVILGTLARSLEAIETARADLQAKFDEDLEASKKAEIGQLGEANIKSNLERHRTLFNSVVDQLKQAQLSSDFGSVSARTINPTQVAAEPPKYASTMTLALLAGCGAGALGAYLVELLDARVRTVTEMRQLLGMPVLGMVPQLCAEQVGPTGRIGLLSHEIPRSALAEAYKSARTNLEFLRRSRRAQVLLISSPQASDGKTTTASNMAIALAHANRKVLLIDGDLRKPSQYLIYNMPEGQGFSDAIQGVGSIEQLARPTFVENLDLLVTGSDVPNPAELLSSPRLAEILDVARGAYDIIIIDSSPLLAVTDPSIIAAIADGILLVVRLARTRRYDVGRTKELLDTMGLPVLGVVINGISNNQLDYGYGGYGYGYGSRNGAVGSTPAAPAIAATSHHLDVSPGLNGRLQYDAESNGNGVAH